MFHSKKQRQLTNADIDRSINLQSSEIKRDFIARLSGKENDMKTMIDSLIKLKMSKCKTQRKEIEQLKPLMDFEKEMFVEKPATTDVGVAATSKDIDITFNRRMNKYSSGDQVKQKIEPVVESTQKRLVPRQMQREANPVAVRQHSDHQHVKLRMLREQTDPNITTKQVKIPNRVRTSKQQMTFKNKLNAPANCTRQQMITTKRINTDQSKPKKGLINKK